MVELAHGAGAIVKVILETCLLSFEEKHRLRSLRFLLERTSSRRAQGSQPGAQPRRTSACCAGMQGFMQG